MNSKVERKKKLFRIKKIKSICNLQYFNYCLISTIASKSKTRDSTIAKTTIDNTFGENIGLAIELFEHLIT